MTASLLHRLAKAAAAIAVASFASVAWAQQTVRVVVPFAAGSSTDLLARQLTDALRKVNGNTYVIDNKPGASGIIGSSEVNKAKPDGATLLLTTGGHITNAVLYEKLPYEPIGGFTPISQLTSTAGFLLMVPANSPYKTLEQLIAAAKAKPDTVSYGSAGNGNTTHLAGALFEKSAGLKLIHAPYKGSPMNDLVAGHIQMLFWGSSFATPIVKDGKAHALAIAGEKRIAELPNVPTLNEKGIQGVDVPAWAGLFGPPGMAPDLAGKIQREVATAMKSPAFIQQFAATPGSSRLASTPAQFSEAIDKEVARLKRDVTPLGIRMD
ncbi:MULTISPECIES: Bug family tripartite tricarboxylate transporter substrate binding protein [Ramlibacter]|uniref:Tripartite tricarboxylate transporter substrate binding protein n=1 Tax=Ramlibacter pinisoli TaxID=2682844 RepID=A0A6N8IZV8_9BURK|nr:MULTISPECIES: tripartite tricarboxylate transporter substrate binding protein [Ramlibacter]MBA2962159.1 tripartite tricarboxylate transporter substrate binding protein [Ramlibacter sp. CGMCC 1.13660]MVQ32102.1 tripartite tricarboxylate transporter substrate binding protein [Ramlibacter pinisoli]